MKVTLLLPCAGKGSRAGLEKNKLLYKFGDKTVLEITLSKFINSGLIDEYVVISSNDDFEEIRSILPDDVKVVIGGDTRTQSVKNALAVIESDLVLIHDGARPFVTA